MCGIAGMIGRNSSPSREAVCKMLETIHHRGPDGEGVFLDQKICFGHRRLAILDLRPEGNQPMHWENRYAITYNGEVYNYIEIRRELEALGKCFSTGTDTEVILAAYAQWGPDCVKRFNGMWAFAIYDKQQQTVFFSRDRFGVKPLYYYHNDEAFYFGSEIKELWTQMPKPVRANVGTLLAFLQNGELDYSEQTCFADVFQVPGGHNIQYDIRTGEFTVKRWYELERQTIKKDYSENVSLFKELFQKAVSLRLRSDVPVGSTLSGGLDSSAITCVAAGLQKEKSLSTISSCFKEKAFDEQEYIDEVTEYACVENHKVWPETKLDIDMLDEVLWHQDEPSSAIAAHYVYKKAKELGITVILVGEGADEQLAGYTNFFEALFVELIQSGQWKKLIEQIKSYREVREPFDHVALGHLLKMTITDALLPVRIRDWLRVNRRGYDARAFFKPKAIHNREVYRARNLYVARNANEVVKNYMFSEMPRILHDLDRMSMMHSVETRAPFLDKDLVQALMNMPLSHKLWNGVTKRVMRDAMRGSMPDKVTDRYGKMGFMSSEFQWFFESPEACVKMIEDVCDAMPEYIDKKAVLTWCETHMNGKAAARNDEYLIARLIMVARWMKIFQVRVMTADGEE